MDFNGYMLIAKDFILDRQFLNLFISTIILFLASLLSWYVYYQQLAKRDLFEIPKLQLSAKFSKTINRTIYFLKYLLIFPIYSFVWFLAFSFLLHSLSKSRPVEDILFLGIIVVAATRIGAYVSEKLAEDMAKLLPLTLIAIFLMDPKAITFQTLLHSFNVLLTQILHVAKYLIFIIFIELLLRMGHWAITSKHIAKEIKP